jgi:hypothetical protein
MKDNHRSEAYSDAGPRCLSVAARKLVVTGERHAKAAGSAAPPNAR